MSLRSLIFNHVWLKFFSLVLATLIWLAVWANLRNEPILPKKFGNDGTFTFIRRPIQVLSDSTDHTTVTVEPPLASVTVRGPKDLIEGLKDEDIDVFVRLLDRRQFNGQLPVHVRVPVGAGATVSPLTAWVKTPDSAAKPPATP